MTKDSTRRAVAKFLAADQGKLDKLRFINRLVGLAHDLGRGRSVAENDLEDALLIVVSQSPHRKWNKVRLSEARLCIRSYRAYDEVVAHLEQGGAYTWHDVIAGFRQWRRGESATTWRRHRPDKLRADLSRFGKARGLAVQSVDRHLDQVSVVFTVTRLRKAQPNKSLERKGER